MIDPFTGCNATIMTTDTGAKHLGMIHLGRGHPQLGHMAGIALLGSGNVGRTPAAGNDPIVAYSTGLGGGGVVKHHTQPRGGDVAHIALGTRGGDVRGRQAGGDEAIVA